MKRMQPFSIQIRFLPMPADTAEGTSDVLPPTATLGWSAHHLCCKVAYSPPPLFFSGKLLYAVLHLVLAHNTHTSPLCQVCWHVNGGGLICYFQIPQQGRAFTSFTSSPGTTGPFISSHPAQSANLGRTQYLVWWNKHFPSLRSATILGQEARVRGLNKHNCLLPAQR